MNITRFSGQPMRNEEYFRHKTEIIEAINKSGIDINPIAVIFGPFTDAVNDIDAALEIIRKSVFTEDIQNADIERDATTTGLIATVAGLAKHFNPEIREQTREIQIIFNHYKGINQQSITSQTASTVNMLQALREKPDLLTVLNINDWVDQLETVNNKVAQLTMNRFDENAAKPLQRMKEARPTCDDRLNKLYNAIETFAQIAPSGEYDKCISVINTINKKYIDTIAQRRGIGKSAKKDEDK